MGTMTIGGSSSGLPGGQMVIGPVTTTGNSVIGEKLAVTLASGDNTFAIPLGSTCVAVFLPNNAAVTVKFRTNSNISDGGTVIAPVSVIPWFKKDVIAGETSVVLNASAPLSGVEIDFV